MPGEGRAVPPVYSRVSEGTPSFTQFAILAKKNFCVLEDGISQKINPKNPVHPVKESLLFKPLL